MSLEDLITTSTPEEMLEEELEIAETEGLSTTMWQSGSVIRTIFVIMANMFSMFSTVIAEPIKGGFGDLLSSLGWAKIWAKQMFDVDHVTAEAATGEVTATNAGDTQYDLDVGEFIMAHNVTGKLYRNTAAVSILANTTTPIGIAAVEVGTSSNAAPGTITTIVGPSLDDVTISNTQAVLGADDETVDALVARARAKMAALSPDGPKDAYNYVVKTPELCDTATPITRSETKASPTTGEVTVYVATADGAPTVDDVAICQDAVEEHAEPWCVTATVVAASEVEIDVTYQVWVRTALLETPIKNAIATALAEYFAALKIGGLVIPPTTTGKVYVAALRTVISNAMVGEEDIGVELCEVTVPDDDVDMDEDEVAVLGTVTGTVTFL